MLVGGRNDRLLTNGKSRYPDLRRSSTSPASNTKRSTLGPPDAGPDSVYVVDRDFVGLQRLHDLPNAGAIPGLRRRIACSCTAVVRYTRSPCAAFARTIRSPSTAVARPIPGTCSRRPW